MNAKSLRKSEADLNAEISESFSDEENSIYPIWDGAICPETFAGQSPPRILWVLKEPWEKGHKKGGWSITKNMILPDLAGMVRRKTFKPIARINHCVFNNQGKPDNFDDIKLFDKICDALKRCAFINVSKIPGDTRSNDTAILKTWNAHSNLILKQIRLYEPNLIFACGPHAFRIAEALGANLDSRKDFGSASAYKISEHQKLIWVYHPNQRKVSHAKYIEDALTAAREA